MLLDIRNDPLFIWLFWTQGKVPGGGWRGASGIFSKGITDWTLQWIGYMNVYPLCVAENPKLLCGIGEPTEVGAMII